ncbi:MBL fold metallo-hydrolase [Georgenia sp. AZ-5]|uniref:MBL fold metallo-hydrolase n=1 Tax=Georgenia sp. AZ-5 TaxID=3367526 RepID=UPI0037551BB6
MSAVRLTDHVWVVGSPGAGPAHTSPYDCVQYLVGDERGGVLVDAGSGLGHKAWRANVRGVRAVPPPAGVVVTHYHGDHAGGAARALGDGLRAYGSRLTADALGRGDEEVTQVARARAVGVYPEHFALLPAPGVEVVGDGDRVDAGGLAVQVLDAPGHCDGHLVLLVEAAGVRMLFSGDLIFAGGKVSMQAIPDCRLDAYAGTVLRLAELDVDQLFPGHGDPVLADARRQIETAARSFARLVPPPNFLS